MVPIVAALAVAALIVSLSLLKHDWGGDDAASTRGHTWPTGVGKQATHTLQRAQFMLKPASSRVATPTDEQGIVDAAVSQMGWVESSQVQSVTPMSASQTSRGIAKGDTVWVIVFDGVSVPSLGDGSDGGVGEMVALVDSSTERMLYAGTVP